MSVVDDRLGALATALEKDDLAETQAALTEVWRVSSEVGDADRERLVGGLTRTLEAVDPVPAALLAVVLGAVVEGGAPPGDAPATVLDRFRRALAAATRFLAAWEASGGGAPPAPGTSPSMPLGSRLRPHLGDDLADVVNSWWSLDRLCLAANTMLCSSPEARRTLPDRRELLRSIGEVEATVERLLGRTEDDAGGAEPDEHDRTLASLGWMRVLLRVLEDERLVVIERAGSRGYAVRTSGVADNFQLHTLLAAALIGDPDAGMIPGVRPEPEWVAAARDAPFDPRSSTLVHSRFDLVDARGDPIRNEGTPADIPKLDGVRVVVLDPPSSERSWNLGRRFMQMQAAVAVDRPLDAGEVAAWLARIAPAKR